VTGGEARADEVLAEAGASWAIAETRSALAVYDAGGMSIGEMLGWLNTAGAEAQRITMRGWDFLDRAAA
jgi:hypothetical protein